MEQNTGSNLFELQVDHLATAYLGETARWAKFLAIVGFVFCGLLALVALFAGTIFSTAMSAFGGGGVSFMGGAALTIIYLLLALLYFFPCLYLFKFASKMQVALRNNDQQQLGESFRNLKSCYRYLGILMIIILGFYALAIVVGGLSAAFR